MMFLDFEQGKSDVVSIAKLKEVIENLQGDGSIGVDSVISWHPERKSVLISEDDLCGEDQPPIELCFTNISSVETMYLALSSMLRHHYTAGLEKLK
jgi:hypothetical protein